MSKGEDRNLVLAGTAVVKVAAFEMSRPPYRCEIRLHAELDDGYSAYAAQLPGVVSEGETREQAIRNVTEALDAALRTYGEARQPIPWRTPVEPLAEGEIQTWIKIPLPNP
jgi:predicted RNase H-like HicB family nuclease